MKTLPQFLWKSWNTWKKSWKYIVVAILGLGLFVSGVLSYSIGFGIFLFLFVTFIFGDLYFIQPVFCTPDSVLKSNNDEEAINNFLQQIEKTEESIQIFDDGDYMKNSIYNKDEVIKTLECKIEENSRFRLDIHFNENEGTEEKRLKIYQLKDDCPKNISIKDGLSKKRNDDLHFKISDFGKYCYVSKHKRGEESRMYLEYHKKPYRITHPMVVKCQETFAEQSV